MGSWAKKGVKSFFGYKGHILIDTKHHLIRNIETTTASVHDSQVDLGIEGYHAMLIRDMMAPKLEDMMQL